MRADWFVSEQPVEHIIEFNGTQVPLFLREVSDLAWRKYSAMSRSDDLDVQAATRAFLISQSVCEPDGTLSMTHEQACRLKLRFARAIETKILELASPSQTEGNDSKPGATIGSGTS